MTGGTRMSPAGAAALMSVLGNILNTDDRSWSDMTFIQRDSQDKILLTLRHGFKSRWGH